LYNAFQQEPGERWPTRSIILGHGSPGYIEVGDGQFGFSSEGGIYLENEDVWAPQFARLFASPGLYLTGSGPVPVHREIMFMSCSTAAWPNGRKLLQRIADVGNLKVTAFIGLIFVNERSMFWDSIETQPWCVPKGSTASRCPENLWKEPPPTTKNIAELPRVSMKRLGFTTGMEADDVVSIAISNPRTGSEKSYPPEVAEYVFKILFHSQPYSKDGSIMGSLTARCVVNYKSEPPMTVNVLADRVAETSSGLVFFTVPNTRAVLDQLENS
jgi:hypothetical protein